MSSHLFHSTILYFFHTRFPRPLHLTPSNHTFTSPLHPAILMMSYSPTLSFHLAIRTFYPLRVSPVHRISRETIFYLIASLNIHTSSRHLYTSSVTKVHPSSSISIIFRSFLHVPPSLIFLSSHF